MFDRLFKKPPKITARFDSKFYIERYPDVATSGLDPEQHYVHHGMKEGRPPNAQIEQFWYDTIHSVALKTKPVQHVIKDPERRPIGSWSVRDEDA
ncbi:hypothetical protein [Achromobacter animicus]|uniref:hypothetical protein n=1 Tax=Achromobacter animicus TaxID=1389935 RepID=UPI00244A95D7|nr:hypothetical protein [Achromobacter animicus]MDH0684983.1 hypothetical protein [Achromobacter animicus]